MVRNIDYLKNREVSAEIPDSCLGFMPVFMKDERPINEVKDSLIVIDQLHAKEFSMNNFGWPRNTISQLSKMNDELQVNAVLRTMMQSKPVFNMKDGLSHSDAFNMLRPRSCQMPSELMEFAEHLAKGDMQKLNDAYDKAYMDLMNKQDKEKSADSKTVES